MVKGNINHYFFPVYILINFYNFFQIIIKYLDHDRYLSLLTQPSSENSGSLKSWKKVKKVSVTALSATDSFNVFIFLCI